MIVLSGALVLIAAVLLLIGIVAGSITLVYAAIGLSLVSAVFLLVGVFQRPVPAADAGDGDADSDATRRQAPSREPKKSPKETAQKPVLTKEPEHSPHDVDADDHADDHADVPDDAPDDATSDFPLEAANADFEQRAEATGADVLVISGRPRYHVGGCEYVEGHDDSEPIEIVEARELGFTPCGVCRPNETLGRGAAGREHAADGHGPEEPSPAHDMPPVAVTAPAMPAYSAAPQHVSHNSVPVQQPAAASAPAVPVTEPVAQAAHPAPPPVAAPPIAAPSVSAPAAATSAPVPGTAPAAPAPPPTAAPVADFSATTAPTQAAQPDADTSGGTPAAPARPRRGGRTVQAVASTREYHRADCELLEGLESEESGKVEAVRRGYLACGVCKP